VSEVVDAADISAGVAVVVSGVLLAFGVTAVVVASVEVAADDVAAMSANAIIGNTKTMMPIRTRSFIKTFLKV
jgi:hypothetical protein